MQALRALGTAFAQAVLPCALICSVLALPAVARADDVARHGADPAVTEVATRAAPTATPAPTAAPSAAPSGAGAARGLGAGVAAGLATNALDSLFTTIGEAAVWAFGKVLGWVDATSSPDVRQPWFAEIYGRTYWLSATIALVAFVWALTTGALRNGVTGMLGVVPRLMLVVLGLAVAVPLVQSLLEFTDWLSLQVTGEVSQNMQHMATALGAVLIGGVGAAGAAVRGGGVPSLVLAVIAMIIVVGSLLVWLQLIFRTAVIYLLLAAAAFPAAMSVNRTSARPIRTIVAWIVAMAFAKPVIVLALWIGSAPFAAGSRADVAAVLTGAGVMVTAVFAPWALFRLFDYAGNQITASVSGSAHPSQLRAHVEHPVTTYQRTATAVQQRASAAREQGVTSFSPTRSRVAVAAQTAATAAAGGAAALRAATGHARRTAPETEGRGGSASARSPGPSPPRDAEVDTGTQTAAPSAAPRRVSTDDGPPRPPAPWRAPVDPTGAHDDE